jgi:hypothetical protein
MRKPVIVGVGLLSVGILTAAGIAAANAATSSPGQVPTRHESTTSTATTIDQAEAERIAVAAVPGGTVTETHLDTDHGQAVWNVHLSTLDGEVEVKVDAQTGEARIDDDNDAEEADDDGDHHGDEGDHGVGEDDPSNDHGGPGADDSSGHH